MRILIFGAGGALAGQLSAVFEAEQPIMLSHADCDITDEAAVLTVVHNHRPTHMLNAAAFNDVDKAEVDDTLARAVNATAVGNLARAARECGAVFVHYSTDYVFDGLKHEGYRESDLTNPINKYGRSKRDGEIEIQNAARDGALSYYLIRTSRLFGPMGATPAAKKNFVDIIVERVSNHVPLEIVGEETSCPTYTRDLAKATAACVRDQWPFGIYHLTNSGCCSRFECAKEIGEKWRELTGTPTPEIRAVKTFAEPRALRPKFSVLLNTKAPPLRSWQDALRDYLAEKVRL